MAEHKNLNNIKSNKKFRCTNMSANEFTLDKMPDHLVSLENQIFAK